MRDLDELIDEALEGEERELLRSIGEEPGFFAQMFGIFGGATGWVHVLMMVVQTALFIAGIWATWNFFEAADALTAVHWGLPAAVLLLMALILKLSLWPTIQANRIIRELKRIELHIVRGSRK